jgi:hypothetical protein
LGAAESFLTSNENTFGDSMQRRYTIFDDDIGKESIHTDGYFGSSPIQNHSPLTPLGLTLKWVSATFRLIDIRFPFFTNIDLDYEIETGTRGIFNNQFGIHEIQHRTRYAIWYNELQV